MPKRTDIQNILILGSGPIVIGQGCEFDYSGTQACKALREEGYSVVLLNSNPATIMTDPGMADRTYIEPITPEFVEKILIKEREDGRPVHALLPTLGGQTALNVAMECHERGVLDKHAWTAADGSNRPILMIGASSRAIHLAEDRTAFKETMLSIGIDVPRSGVAHTWHEAQDVVKRIGLPCCIRPAYTLGGEGGGFARTTEEFETICKRGLAASRVSEILIEEDLYGWKEFELEVMRDRMDNVVIICSIENFDPMGVHTGDSITVAPIQTLTDREYQKMRDSAIAIIRAIGVDTGGCNIQFAVDPKTGRQTAIEMNPRVSRSSALASKATGYPIARIAAKLAVGYTLDELPNDITKTTPASFEPVLDYVVVKIPRWSFEKFPDGDETLTTHMKSVGEAMAIGRNFKEAFQKCIRSMEIKRAGYGLDANDAWLKDRQQASGNRPQATSDRQEKDNRTATVRERVLNQTTEPQPAGTAEAVGGTTASEAPPDTREEHAASWPIPETVLIDKLSRPSQGRPYYIRYAFKMGWSVERVYALTHIDKWFLEQIEELTRFEDHMVSTGPDRQAMMSPRESTLVLKSRMLGYSGPQLARGMGQNRSDECASPPVYKLVDTCAAEFEAVTPYYYSAHEGPVRQVNSKLVEANSKCVDQEIESSFVICHLPFAIQDEVRLTSKPKIVVLGGGPNRIGQGIEFDYCCCHASFAARRAGYESVMINSNPETVSTDFDTSDLLFFEPLTHEDVFNVIERLNCGNAYRVPGELSKLARGDLEESPARERSARVLASAIHHDGEDHERADWLLSELRRIVACYPEDTNVREQLAIGLMNALYYAGPDHERADRLLGELSRLAAGNPEDAGLRERLAKGLTNAIYHVGAGVERADRLHAELRQLASIYPDDTAVRKQLAKSLFNVFVDAGQNQERANKVLDELRSLVVSHPNDATVRQQLAKGLYNAFNDAGEDHKRADKLLDELRNLTVRHPDDMAVREILAQGLTNAITNAAWDHKLADWLLNELRGLAGDHAEDATVRVPLALGLRNAIADAGADHSRADRLLDELRVLADNHAEDMTVREHLAGGLRNALYYAGTNHERADRALADLRRLAYVYPNDAVVQKQLAKALLQARCDVGSDKRWRLDQASRMTHGWTKTQALTDDGGRSPSPTVPVRGVICQFGGQTPLNLAQGLKDAGVPIIGTQPEMIHLAEDREEFAKVLRELSLLQPPSGIARGRAESLRIAQQIGYPILVRPSYVLGGRGMRVCNNDADLHAYMDEALAATDRTEAERDNPILIDKFLVDAIEVDVDAIADFGRVRACGIAPETGDEMCMVAGIMEHIEEAGIHSGDSTCVLPPFSLGRMVIEEIFRSTKRLAKRLQVCGAMNVQYAVLNRTVYVLEVNPRASRTLPFVAKATGVPWAEVATRVMLGEKLRDVLVEHGVTETPMPKHVSVKAPVFPFSKFHGVDIVLGPEMRSTGEVMAIGSTFGRAFAKAQIATGLSLPTGGNVLISVRDEDKPRVVSIARDLYDLGFSIYSTTGTMKVLADAGIPATLVSKHSESGAPFLKDLIENGTLQMLINTPIHTGPASAEGRWRAAAFARRIPIITTLAGALAVVEALRAIIKSEDGKVATPLTVKPLQSYFPATSSPTAGANAAG